MSSVISSAARVAHRRPLAACIASIFALAAPVSAIADTCLVSSCDGDLNTGGFGAGTLRYCIEHAPDTGGLVDLGGLIGVNACANSKISLTTVGGEIRVLQTSLTISGPGAAALTIDGTGLATGSTGPNDSRIFTHGGSGTLTVQNIGLAGGHVEHDGLSYQARGGCIYSAANVTLANVTVSSCSATTNGAYPAYGGGVFTKGKLTLTSSTLSGNSVTASGAASGGGAYAKGDLTLMLSTLSGNKANGITSSKGGGAQSVGNFFASYSTVSDNHVYANGDGGGLFLAGIFNTISASTISGNVSEASFGGVAAFAGGAPTASFEIANSTISNNHAEGGIVGGLFVDAHTTRFYNSTIAFNTATIASFSQGPGVQLSVPGNGMLVTLQNTLMSNNTYNLGASEDDLSVLIGGNSLTFNGGGANLQTPANNLIRKTLVTHADLPTDTKFDLCPLLGRLRNNGGLTQTHALLSTSPAIDTGNDFFFAPYDQRGPASVNGTIDYTRHSPAVALTDIGAYEVQHDDIAFDTDFEQCP